MDHKTCSHCGKTKTLDKYHKAPNGKLNRRARCISCHNKKVNERKHIYNKNRREKYHSNPKPKIKRNQKYKKKKLETDPTYRILHNCRRRIHHALNGKLKDETTRELLGCSTKELKEHLENQFTNKMTWDNYGDVWHIDHEIPCAKFDLSKPHHQEECFFYTNLQPLWAEENFKKSDK